MNVSVVIPTYNRRKELIRAVESALNQTYRKTEVIVVDDGSDEKAGEILKDLNAVNLRIIYQRNKGPATARNRGVEESKSEWLAFLDSDDFWLPDKLTKQVDFHRNNKNILISQTDEEWIRNGIKVNPKKYHLKQGGDIFAISLERCMVSPSAVMIHRRLFEEMGGFDETLPVCEDYDLWLRITARHKVGFIKEQLVVKTGGHADQLSRKYWGMDRFRVKALEKILESDMTQTKKEAAQKILELKLKVLIAGCQKRSKEEEAREYIDKLKNMKCPYVATDKRMQNSRLLI